MAGSLSAEVDRGSIAPVSRCQCVKRRTVYVQDQPDIVFDGLKRIESGEVNTGDVAAISGIRVNIGNHLL